MDTTNKTNTRKVKPMWIVGGCLGAILICVAAVGVILAMSGRLLGLVTQTPDNATVQLGIPAEASIGEGVEFSIKVNNQSAETIELVGVDFSMNFLNGIVIESSNPNFSDSNKFESFGETFITYYFRQSIGPGESLTIFFNAKAVTEGDFSGNVDACINTDYTCVTSVARILIGK